MHIVVRHPSTIPVKKYGGTERIVYYLLQGLNKLVPKLGIKVSYLAKNQKPLMDPKFSHIQFIAQTADDWRLDLPKDTSLVHFHYPPDFALDIPSITTVQGNGKPGETFPLNSVFVSKNHARLHHGNHFIHNCISPDDYPMLQKAPSKKNQFLFLAKASWKVKNVKDCIRAVQREKQNLHIVGGRIFPKRYIKSYGMLGGDKKISTMQKCDALLFPVKWHEPFGIAVIEAMLLGLPVFGSSYGSLPELIVPGTGVTCCNFEEFAYQIHQFSPSGWSKKFIRDYASEHFHYDKMTHAYLQLYEKILKGVNLQAQSPYVDRDFNPGALLPF